ncbi:MAG: sulfite exporter TauE/SafE family protein, partial [Chloroflexi bacterium]|nr:sulfite exporter TauE/SafE family protein [Chloroflexota bacterium]
MPPLGVPVASLMIGMLDGLFSGLTGIGGGAILVPLFVSLLRIPQHRAHGTSLAVIVLVSMAGVPVYAQQGAIDWALAAPLAAGSLVGVVLGARLMLRMRALHLRRVFGVLL